MNRVRQPNGSYRPDVPRWVQVAGGLFFRAAWHSFFPGVICRACNGDGKGWFVRFVLWIHGNYAYWDQPRQGDE